MTEKIDDLHDKIAIVIPIVLKQWCIKINKTSNFFETFRVKKIGIFGKNSPKNETSVTGKNRQIA